MLSLMILLAPAPTTQPPPAVVAYVVSRGGKPTHIERNTRLDVGPYLAYTVRPNQRPRSMGDPGRWFFHAYRGKPMLDHEGDWSGFLRAAAPERIAKALKRRRDILIRQADLSKPRTSLAKELKQHSGILHAPKRTKKGTLVFFIQDGDGDPPSLQLIRVTARAKPQGGIEFTRKRFRTLRR